MSVLLCVLLLTPPVPSASSPTRPAPSATSTAKRVEERPLTVFPAGLRPFIKYGLGGGIALWFVGSIFWMARQRLRQANTPEQQAAARRWIRRLLMGILLAVVVLGVGVATSLVTRELLSIWISAPLALLLPPFWLAWWSKEK